MAKYGNSTFYKSKGKRGLSADSTANVHAFAGTRENGNEFGQQDGRRLTKEMMKVIKADS